MAADWGRSIGEEGTLAGKVMRQPSSNLSLGAERTLGDDRAGQDSVIDEIEVVDLEARYRVEGTLGQGGMGAVLLATDTRLDRKVAIKRILGEAAGNRMAVQRFLTEAKAIAALNHPNVVQIHDYGRAKDGPFLIMEYVDGGSLLDRCRDSALPLDEAINLACQLCDGLAKAHDLGIVHRDIKPANVLLTKDGIPKLTDFGLAKAQASDHGQTMTGAVLGTPDFMPPEQRRDASLVDHRSDLWSLAATVYQMVTGRSPKVIRLHELPQALQPVMARALEDAKEARYQSARDLRDALKTAHRADPLAATVVAGSEGQCPSCSVQNDPKRKFCRGCGGSLEAPCLGCGEPMPMWEEICGACGKKQAPLVEEQQTAEAARQTEAEGLLGDCEFDRAVAAATTLRRDPHPRLRDLTDWVDSFLRQVEDGRTEQVARAVEAIREAEAHDAAHDYLSAIFTLESVPDSLRGAVLPDTRETVANALRRLKRKQAEIKRLEVLLKKRIKEQSLDGLLSEAESLLALEPNRKDIQKIRVQLLEREAKLAAARNEALKAASARMESHDYEGALAVLDTIAPTFVTPEVVILREKAVSSIREAKRLKESIEQAVDSKQFDGLIEKVDAYLRLKPHDDDAKKKLRQALLDRESKIAAEKQRLRHVEALRDLRDQIVAAVAKERFDGLLEKVEVYLQLQPNDPAGQSLLQRLQQLQQERQDDLSRLSKKIPRVLATKEWFVAIDLIEHRGWWRSEQVVFDELLCAVKERHAQSEAALSKRRIVALAGAVVAGICLVMMIMAGRRGESLDYYAVLLWGFLSSIVAIAVASSETSAFVADCGERIRELELRGCGEVGRHMQ